MNDIINVKQKPFLVIEGIYIPEYNKNSSTSFSQNIPTNKFTISYSGSLFKSYGIKKILEVMNYVDDDIELHIFGYGEYKDKVVEASSFDKRIIYNGFLLPHELSSQLSKSSLLLNIRNSSEEFTKLSFPSKIIDYMSTGVPVLTTKLDGIPDEYYDYVYSIDSFDSKIIGEKINEIKKIPNNKRIDLGLKAINFLENEKNTMLQTKKILDFLRSYNS
jgi:glycosyltransferase involved in cell wall biosynthesis